MKTALSLAVSAENDAYRSPEPDLVCGIKRHPCKSQISLVSSDYVLGDLMG